MIEDEEDSGFAHYLTEMDSEQSMMMSLSEGELMAYAESLKEDSDERKGD